MTQTLFAALRPGPGEGETLLELQAEFTPTAMSIELQKSNFGVMAVRVAKALSPHFGGGIMTNSHGHIGEAAIFGKPAEWVDFTGVQPDGQREGITCFDHKSNPGHPATWHVRDDGWMGASLCFHGPREIRKGEPLVLRYLLHAHADSVSPRVAEAVHAEFNARRAFKVVKSPDKHTMFGVKRDA